MFDFEFTKSPETLDPDHHRGLRFRAMKGFTRLFVVGVSVVTLVLMGAVGVSAGSKTFGSDKAVSSVVALVTGHADLKTANTTKESSKADSSNGKDKETGQCHPPKKHHKHGTPGHKHHPCGDEDD